MRTILLLILTVVVVTWCSPAKDRDESPKRGDSHTPARGRDDSPGRGGHRRGHFLRDISERGQHALEGSLRRGMQIGKRRDRLQKLGRRHFRKHRHSPDTLRKMKAAREKIIPITPVERIVEQGDDLFEVNELSGVADYLFQGDINLTDEQLQHLEENAPPDEGDDDDATGTTTKAPVTGTTTKAPVKGTTTKTTKAGTSRTKRQASLLFPKWKDNTVYYYIDSSINTRKRSSIQEALRYISNNTCVYFVEERTATNRVKVFNGEGCYSVVGMVGGEQSLSIGDGCEVIGTVAHEFTHALGIWHTQMRSDRDSNIYIDLEYVDASRTQNFVKYSATQMKNYVPYEYGSMMHYAANSFTSAVDKLSMIPYDHKYAYTMGNRQISFYDLKMINDFYGCSARCSATTSAQCKNGGVPNPRACSKCICPYGYGGTLCDKRPDGCGKSLTATSSWQTETFTFGNLTNVDLRDTYTLCNYWISAPAGKTIKVKITDMVNAQCNYGCVYNGIEIKTYPDKLITNPRYCCPEFNNIEYTSSLNPTPVIGFNRYAYTRFSIQYRYV